MTGASTADLADFLSELERKYFWWEPADAQPRSQAHILAQAMDLATFADIRRLETLVGPDRLVDVMVHAQPGWISDRSWELWRGRLSAATGGKIAGEPPKRSLPELPAELEARLFATRGVAAP